MATDIFGEGSAMSLVNDEPDHTLGALAKQIGSKTLVNRQSLLNILRANLGFPDTNRVMLWRFLLRLPMNNDIYKSLATSPIHADIRDLPTRLPIRFTSVLRRLMRLLSALSYWHPPLAECDWLPSLAFPFLQTCGRDSLVTFEFVATVLCNWCTEWLYFVPNPPITILSRIDHIAQEYGGSAPLQLAWPVLRSFCGEVATTKAAQMIIDHILAARPLFIEYVVAAYALMKTPVIDEQNVAGMLKRAEQMYIRDAKRGPVNETVFAPLPIGHYPVLAIVRKAPMWREMELQRIREEAEVTRQHMELQVQIEKESDRINRQRHKWIGERSFLAIIENEQMDEFRRIQKQTMLRENRDERRALDKRRQDMETRRIAETSAITAWKNDCERIRHELQASVAVSKDTWQNWIDRKEEEAALDRDEVDMEVELLRMRGDVQAHELDTHGRFLQEAAGEESKLVADALGRHRQLEEEKTRMREALEAQRLQQGEDFRARQARSSRL
jgi:hypothetical protein